MMTRHPAAEPASAPDPGPMPVATLAKLFDARLKCDPEREAQAWRDLDALGIVLILDPARWGRTPRRHQAGRP